MQFNVARAAEHSERYEDMIDLFKEVFKDNFFDVFSDVKINSEFNSITSFILRNLLGKQPTYKGKCFFCLRQISKAITLTKIDIYYVSIGTDPGVGSSSGSSLK